MASIIRSHEEQTRQFRQNERLEVATGGKQLETETGATNLPQPEICARQLLEVIHRDPEDLANMDAIKWILKEVPGGPTRRTVIELLQTDYIETEEIADVLPVLVEGYPDQASMQLIEQLAARSRHNRVRAVAKMAHVKGHQAILRFVLFLDNPKWTERMKSFVDESTLAFYRTAAAQDVDLQFKLQELNPLSIYGEFDFGNSGQPIGTMASDMLFSLQHLQVGKPAPNIEGSDLDGLPFSLDEYRGKIVMLDFWGDW